MLFVQKYLRMKHVIVFKLSHEVLQVRARFSYYTMQLTPATTVQLLLSLEDHSLGTGPLYRIHRQELRAHALDAKPSDGPVRCSHRRQTPSKLNWHSACWIRSSIVRRCYYRSATRAAAALLVVSAAGAKMVVVVGSGEVVEIIQDMSFLRTFFFTLCISH